MEGKPEQELSAFHRLKAVFSKFAHQGTSDRELLAALAQAVTVPPPPAEDVETTCTAAPDLLAASRSLASLSSSLSSATGLVATTPPFACPTRRFGRTEIQMPIITCGGMRQQQTWRPAEGFSMADVQAECQQNFEAIVARALELGINHFETAKGYGCSELQYGQALKAHPRETYILQSKVRPFADPAEFRKALDETLERLGTHLDLLGIHGINRPEHLEWVMRPGGCLEVVREYQKLGKVRFLGFSTHAPTPLIVKAIETGVFDYVNLHYHRIGSYTSSGTSQSLAAGPGNLGAIEAAHRHDMGVFIISPNDKGGMLYRPPRAMVRLCSPLSPLIYNDVWLWNLQGNHAIHTLVVGAARPSDFDEAAAAVRVWQEAQTEEAQATMLREVEARLTKAEREVWGEEWADDWWMGLPDCYQNKFGVHVAEIVWLWSITKVSLRKGGGGGLYISFSCFSLFSTHPPIYTRPLDSTGTRLSNTPTWKGRRPGGRSTRT